MLHRNVSQSPALILGVEMDNTTYYELDDSVRFLTKLGITLFASNPKQILEPIQPAI